MQSYRKPRQNASVANDLLLPTRIAAIPDRFRIVFRLARTHFCKARGQVKQWQTANNKHF
ncbi:hypothetical protein Fuma_02505 [Fuerstiella marisgermanici]|uniref:Uncharacterized protein n=1 Tax=Fuerstiella marisgermanici TaxID=1891926 RepID=A0A1P8WFS7_9PLAN|nr:hypothetical protein Fuma_02505 [Fuerstiella marisgermanici]